MSTDDELNLLRRKVAEVEECANQALSVASAANFRISELREAIEKLNERIERLKATAIVEIIG